MKTRLILSEDTLKTGVTGEERFNVGAHYVTPTEVAGARAIVIIIDGRVEIVKAANYGASAELVGTTEVKATGPIEIYPAQNGGFLVRAGEPPGERGGVRDFIAACSCLDDLLFAVARYYQTEAVISGDVDLKGTDPDIGGAGEERTVTDGAAEAGEDVRYVVRTFDHEGSRTGGAVFYDGNVASAVVSLIRGTGADATSEEMPAY